jgi:hypothetical protein
VAGREQDLPAHRLGPQAGEAGNDRDDEPADVRSGKGLDRRDQVDLSNEPPQTGSDRCDCDDAYREGEATHEDKRPAVGVPWAW